MGADTQILAIRAPRRKLNKESDHITTERRVNKVEYIPNMLSNVGDYPALESSA